MYKAKRAIIMAAGIGSRLRPATLDTPKPMVRVNGVRMIDSVIKALHENGIFDIYIVVGYLKEKFEVLTKEYDGIHLIENPHYNEYNNISSLYAAREYLGDCVILDGDQLIFNSEILNSEFEKSCYCCKWTDDETDEWLLTVENGRTTRCSTTGGSNGWQLYSVSFWTKEDGERLKKHLELEFEEKKNYQVYWDNVALLLHPDDYDIGVRQIHDGDIVEIDNYDELIQLEKNLNKLG